MQNSTVLITGANRGIGLELAAQFAADGWNVLACCRNPEAADELRAQSGKKIATSDADALRAMAASVSASGPSCES